MEWGTFGVVHIVSLAAAVVIIIGLYYILRSLSRKVQTIILGILSFSGIAAIIYNLVAWGAPLEYLPLELCSFNALMLPVAVFTRKKWVGNLLLVWSLGALMALVINHAMTEATLFDWPFIFYYFPHVLEFGIPILLFKLGHVEKEPKCIVSTIGITMVVYTLAHFVNLWINGSGLTEEPVNYMFSVDPSVNPLTALFYQIIPYQYWYMYAILPILVIYLGLVYLPQFRQMAKTRKEK